MNLSRQTVALASAGALMLMLAACGKKAEDQTVGQKLDAAVAYPPSTRSHSPCSASLFT